MHEGLQVNHTVIEEVLQATLYGTSFREMMPPKYPDIVFDRAIPDVEQWVHALRVHAPELHCDYWPSETLDAGAVRVFATFAAAKETFEALDNLDLVVSLARGADGLVASGGVPEDVPIAKLHDLTQVDQVTEYIVAALTTHHLRLEEYATLAKNRMWAPLEMKVPKDVHVGILGVGAIGLNAARKIKSLGFSVSVWSRSVRRDLSGIQSFAGSAGLLTMCANTNVLVCTLPHTEKTNGLINAQVLQELAAGAYVINVGRGQTVVDEALIAAIRDGHISGAMLDVFSTEPLPATHEYWAMPEVTVTPHIAGFTVPEARVGSLTRILSEYRSGSLTSLVDRMEGF